MQERGHSIDHLFDLFTGSGVLSLELLHRLPKNFVKEYHCIEIQKEFCPFLEKNRYIFFDTKFHIEGKVHCCDVFDFFKKYADCLKKEDIVVLNPPYYFYGEGQLPRDSKKQQCHFISEDYWLNFLLLLEKTSAIVFFQLKENTKLTEKTLKILQKKLKMIQPLSGNEIVAVF